MDMTHGLLTSMISSDPRRHPCSQTVSEIDEEDKQGETVRCQIESVIMSSVLRDTGDKGVAVLAWDPRSKVNRSSLVATSLIHEDICFLQGPVRRSRQASVEEELDQPGLLMRKRSRRVDIDGLWHA